MILLLFSPVIFILLGKSPLIVDVGPTSLTSKMAGTGAGGTGRSPKEGRVMDSAPPGCGEMKPAKKNLKWLSMSGYLNTEWPRKPKTEWLMKPIAKVAMGATITNHFTGCAVVLITYLGKCHGRTMAPLPSRKRG